MFEKSMKILAIAAMIAMLVGLTGVASAQNAALVDYYANGGNSAGFDGTLRITNFGSSGGGPAPIGNLCAMIYVFDSSEELQECCGCTLTPDGLKTLSVTKDLTSNPNNGVPLTTGEIKILSSLPNTSGVCDPSFGGPTGKVVLTGRLAAWGTHVQQPVSAGFAVTETAAQLVNISTADASRISLFLCGSIVQNSSGKGLCTCGSGM